MTMQSASECEKSITTQTLRNLLWNQISQPTKQEFLLNQPTKQQQQHQYDQVGLLILFT